MAKKVLIALLSGILLVNCNNVDKPEQGKMLPKQLAVELDSAVEIKQVGCVLFEPDTSVAGIAINNAESTLKVLGNKTKLIGDSINLFYSLDKRQILGLTVHAGSFYNDASIFTIYYARDSKDNYKVTDKRFFETEKGIKLGISKKEIIEKLGTCYIAKDSTDTSIELNYRIELPNDSKTKILTTHNMPVYYATYKLVDDRLQFIEFGFEYP